MSKQEHTPEDIRRLQQATEWLIRLQEDDVADEEIVRWIDWCETHADNRKAFLGLLPLWQAFDDRDPSLSISALEKRVALPSKGPTLADSIPYIRRGPLYLEGSQDEDFLRKRRVKASWALAASLLLATAATFIALKVKNAVPTLAPVDTLESKPGHIRPAILPDGSKLDLGARSAIAIDFTGLQRQIEMEDGEAFFTVKPDKQKPFIVQAGNVRVTAVGTQFNVQKAGDRVVVTVSEGTVQIDSQSLLRVREGARKVDKASSKGPAQRENEALTAPAGYQVIYDAALSTKPTMRAIDPAATLAWRQGHLEYVSEPLSSVVATLNRYSERPIILEVAALGRLNYTGTIEVSSVDEWVEALPRIFPVQIHKDSEDQLRIALRP